MQFITTLCVLLSIYIISCIHMYTVVSYVGACSQEYITNVLLM